MSYSNNNSTNFLLKSLVFYSGACVMIVELLGTRIIAPFYGNSIYVWSALISTTMIALAIGYFSGGYLSDKKNAKLNIILVLAAFFIYIIPLTSRTILLLTDQFGLKFGSLFGSILLFAPSLTLLGMIGPIAIKRLTIDINQIGTSVGWLYAISTIGSVFGTLLLCFYLLPVIGTREILFILASSLLLLGITFYVLDKQGKSNLMGFISLILILSSISLVLTVNNTDIKKKTYNQHNLQLQSEQESVYGLVRIIDQPQNKLRFLNSDASVIAVGSINGSESRFAYQEIVKLMPSLKPIKNALIIGLGAGHMANILQKQAVTVDSIEIDPAVADAAFNYFNFKPNGATIIGDARYEIRHINTKYDLIILDCFTGGSEPFYLLTQENISLLRNLLSDDGLLSVNFLGYTNGIKSQAVASVAKTMGSVFPYNHAFVSETNKEFVSFILLASNKELSIDNSNLDYIQKNWLKERNYQPDFDQAILLTDNHNPLEYIQPEKTVQYRKILLNWFSGDLLAI